MTQISDAILVQKREFEHKRNEPYIERNIDPKKMTSPLIKAIIGPRRAGKSFFAIHHAPANTAYVNFDDERLTETDDYDDIITGLHTHHPHPKHLLFDEIQNLPKWELFINRLARQGYNITITGSNANLLSKELSTHLTGRHTTITLLPFSFAEYLTLKEKSTKAETKAHFDQYLTTGGYPEPIIKNLDQKDYLTTLFNATVYKDIVRRYRIRTPKTIEDLAFFLFGNIALPHSYNSLSKITGSVHTVQKYLNYLEEAQLFFTIPRFSFKAKESINSAKKIYSIDNGLITCIATQSSPNKGRFFENLLAIELKRKEYNGGAKVAYWKNQQNEEVDFVLKQGIQVTTLIQACYDVSNQETRKRETRALLNAGKELKCNNLIIITNDYEGEESLDWFDFTGTIHCIPGWKWLLHKI